jgi:biotin synthase
VIDWSRLETESPLRASATELAELLVLEEPEACERLRQAADAIRERELGPVVHLRGIVEFSSWCRCHCLYCGLRVENEKLVRYRMAPEEVVAAAERLSELGMGTIVLQSGEDAWWTAGRMAEVIRGIKRTTGMTVTISAGERPAEDYQRWWDAGADRYLLKYETTDVDLYAAMHPEAGLASRLRCVEELREIGYQVGVGGIVGLPGQTPISLAEDLLFMQRAQIHMAGIGPLIPHPGTPLAGVPVGSTTITLNMVALTRLLLPDALLPATTALETASPGGRLLALQGGANVLMPNLTPRCYAGLYEIYPGRQAPYRADEEELQLALNLIKQAGRELAAGPGHSRRATRT